MEIGHFEDDPEESPRRRTPHSRIPRDDNPDHPNSRLQWFKAGHFISPDDAEISPLNLGLDDRARGELFRENIRPFGKDWNILDALKARVRETWRRREGRPERSGDDYYKMHAPWYKKDE